MRKHSPWLTCWQTLFYVRKVLRICNGFTYIFLTLCRNVIIFFVAIPVPSKSSRALHKTGMTGASGKDYAAEDNKTEEAVDERNAHTR
jgi:hypothetical protein